MSLPAPATPRVLRIEPASRCNLACTHCPTGTVDMPRGLMSDGVFERCERYVAAHRATLKVVVLYHGGEPLLHRRLFELARAIRACSPGVFLKTVTNGMALNDRNQESLLSCGLDEVEISIDGLSQAENDAVRVGASGDRVIGNVKGLLAKKAAGAGRKPAVFVSTTQFVDPAVPIAGQQATPPAWLVREFGPYADRGTLAGFKATFAMRWPHMNVDAGRYDVVQDLADADDKRACDHAVSTTTVRADGTVVPCCYDLTSQLPMGNVLDRPLEEILDGSRYRAFRSSFATGDYQGVCSACNVVRRNAFLVPRWR